MEWINAKEKKPDKMCVCWVTNNKYYPNTTFEALYHPPHDVWIQYGPASYEHPCLEVTHYIIKPSVPFSNESE